MEKCYDKWIDFYYRDITNHYHCKYFPHIQLLDHDNLQKIMSCACHDKATPNVTPLASCQTYSYRTHLDDEGTESSPHNFQPFDSGVAIEHYEEYIIYILSLHVKYA